MNSSLPAEKPINPGANVLLIIIGRIFIIDNSILLATNVFNLTQFIYLIHFLAEVEL